MTGEQRNYPSWFRLLSAHEKNATIILSVEILLFAAIIVAPLALQISSLSQLSRLVQVVGPPAAILISVWVAVTQSERSRKGSEQVMAIAAARAGFDGLHLVAERMKPRLDPKVQQAEGKTLRGRRSRATVEALQEIKLSDLPPEFISHFNRLRSGLLALTEAMDDDPWPVARAPLSHLQLKRFERYAASFEWAAGGYEAMRSAIEARYHTDIGQFSWRVPSTQELRARDEARFPGIAPAPQLSLKRRAPQRKIKKPATAKMA